MPDREEVIAELTAEIEDASHCRHCGLAVTMENALALLKEQKPRVMTPDEIEAMKMGEVAWCEEYYDGPGFLYPMVSCGRGDLGNLYIGINAIGFHDPHRRFWSARPTAEQRKATPWEPPKEG